jgi:hypothetical protein
MLIDDFLDLFSFNKVVGDAPLIWGYDVYKNIVGAKSTTSGLDNIAALADNGIYAFSARCLTKAASTSLAPIETPPVPWQIRILIVSVSLITELSPTGKFRATYFISLVSDCSL